MRQSKLFTKTRKQFAKDEASINARLLIRAGYIDKLMAGAYTYLPLGLRVLRKIEQVIRQNMNKIGGQEIFMPALQPKENWQATGRWRGFDVLFRLKGNGGREYALGPTHEEVVTPLASQFVFSYKDLPQAVYQFQDKFRDEPRAKSGLLRGREFRMKDLYSFHTDEKDLDVYYNKAAKAYEDIWHQLGIGNKTFKTLAAGGTFSKYSHEYQTICQHGEDVVFQLPNSFQTYNREIAPCRAPKFEQNEEEKEKKDILGKGIIGVKELAEFLNIPVEKTTKTILFQNEKKQIIAAAVRGDYDINEFKLRDVSGSEQLELASEEAVRQLTGAELGYAGIIDLPKQIQIFMDDSIADRVNFEIGANRTNYHTINVNFGRDLPLPEKFYDIKLAKPGDLHPDSGQKYKVLKSIEVGNIFKLKTKYSDAFSLNYQDKDGKIKPVQMGCYGIGPGRVMGSIVEVSHDDKGIIWPENIAPYKYHLINLSKDDKVTAQVENMYKQLTKTGHEVLYDDRDSQSPGEKLKDADLIGIPYRLVVSDKTSGQIELKARNKTKTELVNFKKFISSI